MTIEMITEALSKTKNGTMSRIKYKSDLPIKAAFKKMGYVITKVTDATVRFGVDYENIQNVIDYKATHEVHPLHTGYRWVIENKLSHNDNTGKDYVRFASIHNDTAKKKMFYVVKDGHIVATLDSLDTDIVYKDMVQNSYWNRTSAPEVQNVCCDNILSIGNFGEGC